MGAKLFNVLLIIVIANQFVYSDNLGDSDPDFKDQTTTEIDDSVGLLIEDENITNLDIVKTTQPSETITPESETTPAIEVVTIARPVETTTSAEVMPSSTTTSTSTTVSPITSTSTTTSTTVDDKTTSKLFRSSTKRSKPTSARRKLIASITTTTTTKPNCTRIVNIKNENLKPIYTERMKHEETMMQSHDPWRYHVFKCWVYGSCNH